MDPREGLAALAKSLLKSDVIPPLTALQEGKSVLLCSIASLLDHTLRALTRLCGDEVSPFDQSSHASLHLLRELLHAAWTELHCGPWHQVSVLWRRLYATAALGLALSYMGRLEQAKDEAGELLDLAFYHADMGLIMGGFSSSESGLEQDIEVLRKVADSLQRLIGVTGQEKQTSLREIERGFAPETPHTRSRKTTEIPLLPSTPAHTRHFRAVETIDAGLPVSDFYTEYLQKERPVLIKKGCAAWPAVKRWTDIGSRLLECSGRRLVPVEIGSAYTSHSWSQRIMTIKNFVHDYLTPRGPADVGDEKGHKDPLRLGYLAQHPLLEHMPELRVEFLDPDYCFTGSTDLIRLAWIGPAGTTSPFHTDPHQNVFAQISGSKYFQIVPRLHTGSMYPYDTMLSNTSSIDPPDVHLHPVNKEEYPEFPLDETLEATVEAGDLLFIPKGWWHFVKAIRPSVSISYWFEQ